MFKPFEQELCEYCYTGKCLKHEVHTRSNVLGNEGNRSFQGASSDEKNDGDEYFIKNEEGQLDESIEPLVHEQIEGSNYDSDNTFEFIGDDATSDDENSVISEESNNCSDLSFELIDDTIPALVHEQIRSNYDSDNSFEFIGDDATSDDENSVISEEINNCSDPSFELLDDTILAPVHEQIERSNYDSDNSFEFIGDDATSDDENFVISEEINNCSDPSFELLDDTILAPVHEQIERSKYDSDNSFEFIGDDATGDALVQEIENIKCDDCETEGSNHDSDGSSVVTEDSTISDIDDLDCDIMNRSSDCEAIVEDIPNTRNNEPIIKKKIHTYYSNDITQIEIDTLIDAASKYSNKLDLDSNTKKQSVKGCDHAQDCNTSEVLIDSFSEKEMEERRVEYYKPFEHLKEYQNKVEKKRFELLMEMDKEYCKNRDINNKTDTKTEVTTDSNVVSIYNDTNLKPAFDQAVSGWYQYFGFDNDNLIQNNSDKQAVNTNSNDQCINIKTERNTENETQKSNYKDEEPVNTNANGECRTKAEVTSEKKAPFRDILLPKLSEVNKNHYKHEDIKAENTRDKTERLNYHRKQNQTDITLKSEENNDTTECQIQSLYNCARTSFLQSEEHKDCKNNDNIPLIPSLECLTYFGSSQTNCFLPERTSDAIKSSVCQQTRQNDDLCEETVELPTSFLYDDESLFCQQTEPKDCVIYKTESIFSTVWSKPIVFSQQTKENNYVIDETQDKQTKANDVVDETKLMHSMGLPTSFASIKASYSQSKQKKKDNSSLFQQTKENNYVIDETEDKQTKANNDVIDETEDNQTKANNDVIDETEMMRSMGLPTCFGPSKASYSQSRDKKKTYNSLFFQQTKEYNDVIDETEDEQTKANNDVIDETELMRSMGLPTCFGPSKASYSQSRDKKKTYNSTFFQQTKEYNNVIDETEDEQTKANNDVIDETELMRSMGLPEASHSQYKRIYEDESLFCQQNGENDNVIDQTTLMRSMGLPTFFGATKPSYSRSNKKKKNNSSFCRGSKGNDNVSDEFEIEDCRYNDCNVNDASKLINQDGVDNRAFDGLTTEQQNVFAAFKSMDMKGFSLDTDSSDIPSGYVTFYSKKAKHEFQEAFKQLKHVHNSSLKPSRELSGCSPSQPEYSYPAVEQMSNAEEKEELSSDQETESHVSSIEKVETCEKSKECKGRQEEMEPPQFRFESVSGKLCAENEDCGDHSSSDDRGEEYIHGEYEDSSSEEESQEEIAYEEYIHGEYEDSSSEEESLEERRLWRRHFYKLEHPSPERDLLPATKKILEKNWIPHDNELKVGHLIDEDEMDKPAVSLTSLSEDGSEKNLYEEHYYPEEESQKGTFEGSEYHASSVQEEDEDEQQQALYNQQENQIFNEEKDRHSPSVQELINTVSLNIREVLERTITSIEKKYSNQGRECEKSDDSVHVGNSLKDDTVKPLHPSIQKVHENLRTLVSSVDKVVQWKQSDEKLITPSLNQEVTESIRSLKMSLKQVMGEKLNDSLEKICTGYEKYKASEQSMLSEEENRTESADGKIVDSPLIQVLTGNLDLVVSSVEEVEQVGFDEKILVQNEANIVCENIEVKPQFHLQESDETCDISEGIEQTENELIEEQEELFKEDACTVEGEQTSTSEHISTGEAQQNSRYDTILLKGAFIYLMVADLVLTFGNANPMNTLLRSLLFIITLYLLWSH